MSEQPKNIWMVISEDTAKENLRKALKDKGDK